MAIMRGSAVNGAFWAIVAKMPECNPDVVFD
jgi:hypothetical protein